MSLEEILTIPPLEKIDTYQDHLGNVFNSLTELCQAYHINECTFKSRINQCGWTLQKALTTPVKDKTVIDHLGNVYSNVREMCRQYNIDYKMYLARIDRHWSVKESLTTPPLTIVKEDYLGNNFVNTAEMCKNYNIKPQTYNARIRKGMSPKEALSTPLRDYTVKDHLGNEYSCIEKMCAAYGITGRLYDGRIRSGWSQEEALTIPKNMYIGEYRVAECLKRLNVKYYHDCSIKKIFQDLNTDIDWDEFLSSLRKHLGKSGVNWSKEKIQRLRPDFVLYTDDNNTIRGVIEFDGEQHQNFVEYFFKTIEEFYRRSNTDFVKQSLWEYMNIPMLRIRHDQIDMIDDMVTDFVSHPQNYICNHNTYLSEEEYWSILSEEKSKLDFAFAS